MNALALSSAHGISASWARTGLIRPSLTLCSASLPTATLRACKLGQDRTRQAAG